MTVPEPPALPGVESFVIDPPGLGVALRISIARPAAGMAGPPTGPMAVAYVTDADFCFGTAAELGRMMGMVGEIQATVVVGIGYADETGDYVFTNRRRGTDFYSGPRRGITLPPMGQLELGRADVFLAAIRDHVIPEVERRAPEIDPARRYLFGTSAGGHFAAYVLTTAPSTFAGFALMSPALHDFPPSGPARLVREAQAMAPGTIPAGTRVFLSAGEREEDPGNPLAAFGMISNLYPMQAALVAQGAVTQLTVLAGESHTSVVGAAISRAFRFLLPPAGPSGWERVLKPDAG